MIPVHWTISLISRESFGDGRPSVLFDGSKRLVPLNVDARQEVGEVGQKCHNGGGFPVDPDSNQLAGDGTLRLQRSLLACAIRMADSGFDARSTLEGAEKATCSRAGSSGAGADDGGRQDEEVITCCAGSESGG
ncbi:MAG: hypothetical protein ACYC0X_28270 [Pirellulaceae bacterium]